VNEVVIKPLPITPERFAPYGDVIHASPAAKGAMNDARFERFRDLAKIDVADAGGRAAISIARCKSPAKFPYRIDMVERHPHGSQAFIPLAPFPFVVVVAPAGESVDAAELCAFVTNGTQGINYHKGVWHMPLIAMDAGQEFLIVDRMPATDNCEEFILGDPPTLEGP
jgi:ureidoglycolate lyase